MKRVYNKMLVYGGGMRENKKNKSLKYGVKRRYKGGSSPLSPSSFDPRDTIGATPPAGADNFNKMPTMPGSSTQVGGAYGFDTTSVSGNMPQTFAGSYAAPTNINTGGSRVKVRNAAV